MVRALENDVCGKSLTFVVFVYCLYTNERIPVLAVPWKFFVYFCAGSHGFFTVCRNFILGSVRSRLDVGPDYMSVCQ